MKTYTEKQTEEEHTIYQALGYKIKIQGLIKKENKTYQSILKVIEEFEPYFHTTNENIQKTTKLILGEHSTKYDANKQIQKTLPHITIEDIIQNHKKLP